MSRNGIGSDVLFSEPLSGLQQPPIMRWPAVAKVADKVMDVLIVDTESSSVEKYQRIVQNLGHRVCGICRSAEKALCLSEGRPPDIALINIKLAGEMNGLGLGKWLRIVHDIIIIYVDDEPSEENFEKAKQTAPFAFISNTIDKKNLSRILVLAFEFYKKKTKRVKSRSVNDDAQKHIFVKSRAGHIRIKHTEITFIKAEDKYCVIHLENGNTYIKRIAIKKIIQQLDPSFFARSHRGYVVNLDKVEKINLQDFTIQIKDNTIPLGNTYKNYFLEKAGM